MQFDTSNMTPEYVAAFPGDYDDDGFRVEVEKVGGGTVGKSYAGEYWLVRRVGFPALSMYAGMPHTHAQIAREFADYVREGYES